MIVCGLDMSSNKSGYSLFNGKELVEYGLWVAPKELEWRDRVLWMGRQLSDFIKTNKIDKIVIEDVPLILKNPQTLKILCALQGVLMGVVATYDIQIEYINVSEWRSRLGLFTGSQKDTHREEMKKSSIDYANDTFGLNLVWKSKSSGKNEDDIADSINVAWSTLIDKVKFGMRR